MSSHPHKLTPAEAVGAADAVYRLKQGFTVEKSFEVSQVNNLFNFSKKTAGFSAQSGMFEFKQNAGFAAMAMGKDRYQNHAILVCRGTDGAKDWLSDFNIGAQLSLSGHVVHAGFNRIYNQFRGDLLRFIDVHHPSTIHCVGHSLGGALANLAADTIIDHGQNALLYTFGAPRVGTNNFAHKLSRHPRLGEKNIFRVYHSSDPVSMIPLLPFLHAPQPGGEYYINKTLIINPLDHKIAAYTRSMEHAKSWQSIKNPHPSLEALAQQWMTSDAPWIAGGLNIQSLSLVMKGVSILLKNTLSAGWNIAGGVAVAGVTILDQLSLAVSQAGQVSKEKEGIVMRLLSRILQMLGIHLIPGQSFTLAFVQFVFRSLNFALGRAVRIALS